MVRINEENILKMFSVTLLYFNNTMARKDPNRYSHILI